MSSLETTRQQGAFVEEQRCACPVNQLQGITFTKVVCKSSGGICLKIFLSCVMMTICLSLILAIPALIIYLIKGADFFTSLFNSDAYLYILAIVVFIIVIMLAGTIFTACASDGPHSALQVLFNCRTCGHSVNRTYECIVEQKYDTRDGWAGGAFRSECGRGGYRDGWGTAEGYRNECSAGGFRDGEGRYRRSRWTRTGKAYNTFGRYTNTEKTLVLNKSMASTNFDEIERKYDEMDNNPADKYKTSRQWTEELILRLD